ncbi:MAG TPA: demethoxyubiquinone hydroxylase family protein [Gammaproteobacteria bacterium]|jgi:ubiquinone biosynthesis monooxygenase Coq7|nr:demethoxyubiquinone hydroxylase family protein [Gammaproteobacteria bacterium]
MSPARYPTLKTHHHYLTPLDRLLIALDNALITVAGMPTGSGRDDPADGVKQDALTQAEREEAARLMRVNHVGEICAQALYQGQSLTSRNATVRQALQQASIEENDHLRWCKKRIQTLGGSESRLNLLWYSGAFVMGAVAGVMGDGANLGFVEETEQQVEKHLSNHLKQLPRCDHKSHAVLTQMRADEQRHAQMARRAGATTLPGPIRSIMRLASRVMTSTAYRL